MSSSSSQSGPSSRGVGRHPILASVLRQTDAHNRMIEERRMWLLYEREQAHRARNRARSYSSARERTTRRRRRNSSEESSSSSSASLREMIARERSANARRRVAGVLGRHAHDESDGEARQISKALSERWPNSHLIAPAHATRDLNRPWSSRYHKVTSESDDVDDAKTRPKAKREKRRRREKRERNDEDKR